MTAACQNACYIVVRRDFFSVWLKRQAVETPYVTNSDHRPLQDKTLLKETAVYENRDFFFYNLAVPLYIFLAEAGGTTGFDQLSYVSPRNMDSEIFRWPKGYFRLCNNADAENAWLWNYIAQSVDAEVVSLYFEVIQLAMNS